MINWRKPAYFAAHRLIGSNILEQYREYFHAAASSAQELRRLEQLRLDRVLQHAARKIPFYRRAVSKTSPVLADFPILTKAHLKEHFQDFMEADLLEEYKTGRRKKKYSWVEVKTGGSTGIPTTVIHDAEFRDRGRAGRLFTQHLAGFPLGAPYFMLWGSMRDINDSKDSLTKRVLHRLHNARVLNAFRMDEDRMAEYVAIINNSPVDCLMAYADACDQLARFILNYRLQVKPLRSIMACGGTVTAEMRQRMEKVFSAPVHNKYGSRDCTDMACECARGGFHIFNHHVHLEVVDEQGQPAPAGQTGRILVTLLHNHSFPLIRYEIGDIGSLRSEPCGCGLPFPLLDKVEGRTVELLTDTRGNYITPIYIRHLIGVVHNPQDRLRRFQLTQLPDKLYELSLETAAGDKDRINQEVIPQLHHDLIAVFGQDATLDIYLTEHIAETDSGKFLYVRNLTAQT